MAESKIGSVFVQVAIKGLSVAQKSLALLRGSLRAVSNAVNPLNLATKLTGMTADQVRESYKRLADQVQRVGSLAVKGFAAGSAGALAFARSADPVGWLRLQSAFAALSVHLGSIFIPIMDKLTALLEFVVTKLKGMTTAQKEQALWWTQLGLGVAGGVAIFAKLAPILSPLIGLLSGLAGYLLPIAAGLAVVAGAFYFVGRAANKSGQDLSIWQTLILGMQTAWQAVSQAAISVGSVLADVFRIAYTVVAPIIQTLLRVVNGVVDSLIAVFMKLYGIVQPIFSTISATWEMLVDSFLTEGGVMSDLVGYLTGMFDTMGTVVMFIFKAMKDNLILLRPVFETVFGVIKSTIDATIKSLIFLSKVLQQVAKGNFSGALSAGRDAVQEYEDRIKKKEEEANEKVAGLENGRSRKKPDISPDKAGAPGTNPNNRFTPLGQQKADLIGIVDAWRKAQTANNETPEARKIIEQNELIKANNAKQDEANGYLKTIAGKGNPPATLAPGM